MFYPYSRVCIVDHRKNDSLILVQKRCGFHVNAWIEFQVQAGIPPVRRTCGMHRAELELQHIIYMTVNIIVFGAQKECF